MLKTNTTINKVLYLEYRKKGGILTMNKSELRITKTRAKQAQKIRQKHKDTVGVTQEDFYNYILKKIIAKDYVGKRGREKNEMTRVKVDVELRNQATEIAKSLGFRSINTMIESIVADEYYEHVYNPEKAYKMFEATGRKKRNEIYQRYKDKGIGEKIKAREMEKNQKKAKEQNMEVEGAFEKDEE